MTLTALTLALGLLPDASACAMYIAARKPVALAVAIDEIDAAAEPEPATEPAPVADAEPPAAPEPAQEAPPPALQAVPLVAVTEAS